ncbi:MAG: hypothetical protein KDC07_12325 [Chitinophagaceae bacterium]|nr:hypothetical protein [Chitinophagaceae bacterium]MCB9046790.1 hypothetical protein [Chitinophagales bacterium]
MNIKTLFITIICIGSFSFAYAQDELHKKNGDVMDVKVIEVGPKLISYQKSDNLDGPIYKIEKDHVSHIVYANGSEDNFAPVRAERETSHRKQVKYGNNIVSFIPMEITSGVGIGLSYERVIDKKTGILSFYMPVTIAFANDNYDPVLGTTSGNTPPTYYIMPGLKFYPTGSKGVVRYAVGPNLAYISGQQYSGTEFIYDNNGNIIGQTTPGWEQRTALGIMVTNSLNINPNAHLHLGLELGLGFTYFDKVGNTNLNTNSIGQFGFKIGYRF